MIAPRLYIFGVPDGFDMLDGSRQEISYFQRFYDGSTEDTKFTAHRDSNGTVTYTFLKYNLSSGKSRTGSFFGMSLAFAGYYCTHPLKLYELFDYVYQSHVLCDASETNKGILKSVDNSDIRAQYLITRFEDRRELVRFIEKVFQHNLATNDVLSTSFYPLDPGFKNENQNLGVSLPLIETNDDVLIASLRAYNYVTISPNWVKDDKPPRPEIPSPLIEYWKKVIPLFQDFIINGLRDLKLVRLNDVQNYQNQTEDRLYQLRNNVYNKNNAPTLETDYEKLSNQLADLYQKASDAQNGGGGDPLPPPPLNPNPPKRTPNPSFWERAKEWVTENKSKVAGIIGAAAVVVVLLALFLPKLTSSDGPKDNPKNSSYCELAKDSIRNKLTVGSYVEAKEIAERIPDELCREEELDLVKNEQADALDKEINQLMNEKNWKDAFDKAEQYFDKEAKNTKIDEIRIACEKDFTTRIGEVNESNYSSKSPGLEQELLAVKGYIGNENYKVLKEKLDKKNKPKEEPKPKTSNYEIEFFKTNSAYTPFSDTPTKTFRSNGTINVGDDNYIYRIKKDGNYLSGSDLQNAVKADGGGGEINTFKTDHFNLWLQNSSGGTLTIGTIKITIAK